MNAAEEIQRGLAHYRSGRFNEARRCYENILIVQANHSRALELAGLASLALKQIPVAVAFLERALNSGSVTAETWFYLSSAHFATQRWELAESAACRACELKPDLVEAWCARGMASEKQRHWPDAQLSYEKAVSLRPSYAEVHCNLGGVFLNQNEWAKAKDAFSTALSLKLDFPEALNGLGVVHKTLSDFSSAEECFEKALQHRPSYLEARYNLANLRQTQERWEEAITAYQQVLAGDPKSIEARHNLGCAWIGHRSYEEAIRCFQDVIVQQPDHADAYNHLGNALLALSRHAEATQAYETALRLKPGFVDALCNLGNASLAQNDPEGALRLLREAALLAPSSATVEFNTAIALLVAGQWSEGFQKYERRWDTEQKAFRRSHSEPLWLGHTDLAGKSILLYAEQGIGDTLQFVRYVSHLKDRGAEIFLQVQDCLKPLLSSTPGVTGAYSKTESPSGFDYQCPLGSLPLAFSTEVPTVPAPGAYIFAAPQDILTWRGRIAALPATSRIGIVCSGNARHKNDSRRSIPLSAFEAIAEAVGAPLHLVQKDFRATDAGYLAKFAPTTRGAAPVKFINWSNHLTNFSATAGLVEALDLIITVDTSVAHLAGAMGKPTWILVPFAPDWRWLLDRTDSPWYPMVRLFRQPRPGDWGSVINAVIAALELWNAEAGAQASRLQTKF